LAGGASLVVLAATAGAALTTNLLMSLMYQQRREFTVLTALGAPITTPMGIATVQALVVGTVGGAIGVTLTLPAVRALDRIAATLTGFEGVVRTTPEIMAGGFAVALVMSLIGAIASVWRIARSIDPTAI
jgi:putative ABC transport system permease protein